MHILYSHALINPTQREKMLFLQIFPNSGQFWIDSLLVNISLLSDSLQVRGRPVVVRVWGRGRRSWS